MGRQNALKYPRGKPLSRNSGRGALKGGYERKKDVKIPSREASEQKFRTWSGERRV